MNAPETIVEVQTDALLRRVAREQEARCRHAREAADEQARAIVGRAFAEARARLRQAVEEERRAIEQTLADRRATHETAARRRSQAALRAVIDEAWLQLPPALASEWTRTDVRRRWCEAACKAARDALQIAQGLALEVDSKATDDVEGTVRSNLGDIADGKIEVRRVGGLGPGLRIRCGRACVDATVPGLLAARDRIEADLLDEISHLEGSPA